METNDRMSARAFTGYGDSWKPQAYTVLTMMIALGFVSRIWGYQGAARVDCALPAAYGKAIAWDSTLGNKTTDDYDSNIGGFGNGRYWLTSDLTVYRMVLDRGNTTVFDLGDGRTLTSLGQSDSSAIGATKNGSGATVQLKSGTMLFPPSPYLGVKTFPYLSLPRQGINEDSAAHDMTFIVGGGSTEALLDTQRVQLLWGTNNWLVVTNNGRVAVSGNGTYLATSGGNATATRNGIRVTDGGVYSNAQAGVVLPFTLFGLAGSTGNVFEVTNGGRLEGWERFALSTSAGNTLAFRGAATKQVFNVTNTTAVCVIDGQGTRLEVTDGAALEIKDGGANGRGRFWMGTNADSYSNVIHVTGAGSVLSCGSNWGVLIGQKFSCDNRVVISDGAKAVLPQLHIGQEGTAAAPTARNVVRVETGGTLIDSNTLTVGYGEIKTMNVGYAVSNRLEVASGGSVTAACLVVSTATNAYGNAVDITDGTVTVNEYVDFGRYGQASRITVRDGGRLTAGGNFNFGRKEGVITSNNVMHVLSGGEVLAKQFVVYGTNHALVVSNGTIRTADVESHGIQLPWYNNARDWDFTLEIAGTNPVLRAEGVTYTNSIYVFGIRRGATVKFRVPENGFIEAPLQAPKGRLSIFWDANGNYPTFDFDVTACGHRYVVCPIAEGNPLTIDTPTWNYLKNNLPENCRLKYSDNRLTLYVNEQSTCILIR